MSKQVGIIGFNHIIKNYKSLALLGSQIIHHKQYIVNIKPEMLDKEFAAQEERIEQFFYAADLCNKQWKNNSDSINEFWTGY
tara:strand:+ start:389 stop:634 length:246 start_codon:yes stop_codon:yes gene_type:complete